MIEHTAEFLNLGCQHLLYRVYFLLTQYSNTKIAAALDKFIFGSRRVDDVEFVASGKISRKKGRAKQSNFVVVSA